MEAFNEIPRLDEREVQTEFDTMKGERVLNIFTTNMWLTTDGARQLRDWLSRALPESVSA
jgi:hypothetical protein